MLYINHRINTPAQLAEVPKCNGAEIDVRYHEDQLILHHDPFAHHRTAFTPLRDWLTGWSHDGPLILNIKTEGIERQCIELMEEFCVRSWFFLDLSMPYFVLYSKAAERGDIPGFGPENLAVRFSEHEPIEYALAFSNRARWVWVDCFSHLPLNSETAARFADAGFRTCVVSPELQRHSLDTIRAFRAQLDGIAVHAVCTKRPDLWSQTEMDKIS